MCGTEEKNRLGATESLNNSTLGGPREMLRSDRRLYSITGTEVSYQHAVHFDYGTAGPIYSRSPWPNPRPGLLSYQEFGGGGGGGGGAIIGSIVPGRKSGEGDEGDETVEEETDNRLWGSEKCERDRTDHVREKHHCRFGISLRSCARTSWRSLAELALDLAKTFAARESLNQAYPSLQAFKQYLLTAQAPSGVLVRIRFGGECDVATETLENSALDHTRVTMRGGTF
ncbi:hypothetical protein FB451DRAFT_1476665 [Mycena latifolia]|nr:hypothetical protein FB451DRAFT_1476665 [Mycena latifolia]